MWSEIIYINVGAYGIVTYSLDELYQQNFDKFVNLFTGFVFGNIIKNCTRTDKIGDDHLFHKGIKRK